MQFLARFKVWTHAIAVGGTAFIVWAAHNQTLVEAILKSIPKLAVAAPLVAAFLASLYHDPKS